MNFPKRFEMLGIDPRSVKVKVVYTGISGKLYQVVYDNIAKFNLNYNNECGKLVGPMADKLNGEWCLRFESKDAYRRLSE